MAGVDPITAGENLVDDVVQQLGDFFDPTKKAQAQAQVEQIKQGASLQRLQQQISVIVAEAQSGSWITRTWRPITMLTFLAMVVSWWLGWTPARATPEQIDELFTLIKLGLGGYVGGRSLEKVATTIAAAVKKK
jgi:hypothetical protein